MTQPPPATTAIATVRSRAQAMVQGRIVAIHVEPKNAAPRLIARIDDGTGKLDAIFMGRRHITGVEPGATISVSGMVCDADPVPCVYNPRYELV